jgi:hypothetical protein
VYSILRQNLVANVLWVPNIIFGIVNGFGYIKIMKKSLVKITGFIFAILFSNAASAQLIDSSFYQWSVYEIDQNDDDKKCYIVANPIKSSSNHNARQKPYIMITRFQKDRSEEFSVFSGFEFKSNAQVFLLVDAFQHKLIAKKDFAWALKREEDVKIIQQSLNGAKIRVRSDSAVGTYAVDEYSLQGITMAYLRMREICK